MGEYHVTNVFQMANGSYKSGVGECEMTLEHGAVLNLKL